MAESVGQRRLRDERTSLRESQFVLRSGRLNPTTNRPTVQRHAPWPNVCHADVTCHEANASFTVGNTIFIGPGQHSRRYGTQAHVLLGIRRKVKEN